jgi:LPXTG-motif cell wall-anchored protein
MPRTDAGAESISRQSPRRVSLRKLLALPAALALLAALATPAVAAEEPTSGYTHTEPSKQETLPAKETTTPEQEPAPTEPTAEAEPAPTTTQAKQATLPYTGLNLTWVIGFGLVLMGAGSSIVMVQRRQRRSDR